jgi:hypothetical protein
MSRAFVKEPDGGEAFEDLPDRPISEHPNLVTPEGLAQMEDRLARLHEAHAEAQVSGDRAALANAARSALLDGAALDRAADARAGATREGTVWLDRHDRAR